VRSRGRPPALALCEAGSPSAQPTPQGRARGAADRSISGGDLSGYRELPGVGATAVAFYRRPDGEAVVLHSADRATLRCALPAAAGREGATCLRAAAEAAAAACAPGGGARRAELEAAFEARLREAVAPQQAARERGEHLRALRRCSSPRLSALSSGDCVHTSLAPRADTPGRASPPAISPDEIHRTYAFELGADEAEALGENNPSVTWIPVSTYEVFTMSYASGNDLERWLEARPPEWAAAPPVVELHSVAYAALQHLPVLFRL
jgi:hypothetical protein